MIKQFLAPFLFFTLFCGLSVFADYNPDPKPDYHPMVIPPAPTAGALGNYGNVPVNMAAGTPSVSIPLYTLKSKNASLPITLSYNNNGLKVDEIASWVGHGWSLNAGGVITRTVRGGADENSRCAWNTDLDENIPSTWAFLQYTWDHTTDTEPDIFNYNFNGFSGKFLMVPEKNYKVYTVPYNNLKITPSINPGDYNGIVKFTITTPDGVVYTFGEEYRDESDDFTGSCKSRTYEREVITAWHLKKN